VREVDDAPAAAAAAAAASPGSSAASAAAPPPASTVRRVTWDWFSRTVSIVPGRHMLPPFVGLAGKLADPRAPYDRAMPVPPEHREFALRVADARAVDPMPTFRALSENTGVPVDDLVHYALVRWASAGAEALLAIEPQALRDLLAARAREDWAAVAGIIDWLEAGRA
jgi:hypothetical protein